MSKVPAKRLRLTPLLQETDAFHFATVKAGPELTKLHRQDFLELFWGGAGHGAGVQAKTGL